MLVLMIDQSVSMGQPCSYLSESKAVVAAKILNRLIDSIIERYYGGHVRNCCFIVSIGYSIGAAELFSGFLSDLDNSPKRIEKVRKIINDGAGGLVEIDKTIPIWVEPTSDVYEPNMVDAFKLAEGKITEWVTKFPGSPAPIIINISSGQLSSDELQHQQKADELKNIANKITQIKTDDGNTLIFNIAILDTKQDIVFPTKSASESYRDINLKFLSDISSYIPQEYEYRAQYVDIKLDCPAKGIISANYVQELLYLIG
jgi:hypothetical protein